MVQFSIIPFIFKSFFGDPWDEVGSQKWEPFAQKRRLLHWTMWAYFMYTIEQTLDI